VLTCTSIVSHEINTRTDSAPVNVRPYRLPEKHKKEVSRQIEKMLSEKIIRPNNSSMERADIGGIQEEREKKLQENRNYE